MTRPGRKNTKGSLTCGCRTRNQITVVDPQKPTGDRHYILEFIPGEKGAVERVFLLNPANIPRSQDLIFELNTVFTVSLADGSPGMNTKPPAPLSMEDVKRGIDRTLKELKGTKDFTNPRVWRKKGAAFGLPGLDLPVEYGGLDWPASKMIDVFKYAGSYNLNFRDVVGGAHVRPLMSAGTPAVKEIIRGVARGDYYMAITITEPSAGSDMAAITSSSRKVPGGYLLTGSKLFNARLEQATHVIIFTRASSGKESKLSAFVVPIDAKGLDVKTLTPHGLMGNSYGGLEFKDVFVPDEFLLGKDGEGFNLFFTHFLYWRLMQSVAAIGTGENALAQMAERLKTRQAFGGPIGRFTHLQQALGQHAIELKMAEAYAREAAKVVDRGDYGSARAMICGLKAEGVEIALKAVDASMRAFGGEGYSTMVDLGDRLRDLTGLRIADGTTDVMRMDVVRQLYGPEFWEMAIEPRKKRGE